MGRPFLSICIPSYNRPDETLRLLRSVDSKFYDEIEIVITEDNSPKREEVRNMVEKYKSDVGYKVNYFENPENFGYDHNIRHVADLAEGEWVMFMGDDDVFVEGSLDKYIAFLKKHSGLGYVLRHYYTLYKDGSRQDFRYDNKDVFFEAGEEAYVELFRRSVFISGFCFRKDLFNDYGCSEYDGTLLFQLYIQATICLKHPSAYCDIPITQSIEGHIPYFGNSKAEKGLYTPNKNTTTNSLNFMKQVRIMAISIDNKNNINCTKRIMDSYSKYSYGFLHEQRDEGVKEFTNYAKGLKELGYASTPYFYIYYLMLLILGKSGSRKFISFIKKIHGKTPKL